jgi:hypothetical protein
MGEKIELEVYHGTDYEVAQIIISKGFKFKENKEHWLGNGIYFYNDISLARWWTEKPTNKFGTDIKVPGIVRCVLSVDNDRLLDLRKLDHYIWFSDRYKEFYEYVINSEIVIEKEEESKEFKTKQLRCAFCDFLKNKFTIDALVGTFDLPEQPYLPCAYGTGFNKFALHYIETQVCVFNPDIITNKQMADLQNKGRWLYV